MTTPDGSIRQEPALPFHLRGNDAPVIKYDVQTGGATTHDFGPGRVPAEPVFVPASAGAPEDEGWVLTYVYDAARDGSDLMILDASRLTTEPVAVVRLPQRVPFGFHGSWLPDPA